MSAEIEQFLDIAQSRISLIYGLLEQGQVYMPAEERKTAKVRAIIEAAVFELDVEGREYLEEAWNLVLAGKKMVITSNHQSDTDHDAKRYILERLNLREFADRIFFVGGLKMLEREETRVYVPSENVLFVPTPMDLNNMKRAADWMDELTTGQEKTFLDYADGIGALGKVASAEYSRLVALGMVPLFYPEATRSRDKGGKKMRAPKEVTSLIPKDPETYVLPWVTDGTANIMNIDDRIRLNGTKLGTVIGNHYPAREIFTTNKKGISLDGSPATYADVVMARLAVLKPELAKDEDLEFYMRLCGTYNPRKSTREIFNMRSTRKAILVSV